MRPRGHAAPQPFIPPASATPLAPAAPFAPGEPLTPLALTVPFAPIEPFAHDALTAFFTPVESFASDAPPVPLALAGACYGVSRGVMAISIARYIVIGLAVW